MIGSNLYVGDFSDYQPDELFKFQSNFNLQLPFLWHKILMMNIKFFRYSDSINVTKSVRSLIACSNLCFLIYIPRNLGLCPRTYVGLDILIAISVSEG